MEDKFLEKFLKKYNIDDNDINRELISELYDYDPSPNKKYLHWLYVKFADEFGVRNVKYFDHEYWDGVNKALVVLDNYSDRFKNAGLSTDIYSYNDLDSFIMSAEKAFQRSNKKIQLKNDIDLVDEFDGIVILYPSTSDASCYYGRGTRWCVTNPTTYEEYMEKGNLFFILNRSSSGGDYKTAIYIDVFGKIEGYDASDTPLTVSFGDIDKIEYDEYAGSIVYPKKVGSSIKNYLQTKISEKPKEIMAKAFANWVKSLGNGYNPKIMDIDDLTFYLNKKNRSGINYKVGEYVIADNESLEDMVRDIDGYGILNSSKTKTKNLIKHIGEKNILKYFDLDGIFNDMLIDSNRFRFFYEYDIDNLTDKEIEKSPELNDLKKQFMENPVEFYDDNKYKGSSGEPPKYSNIDGLLGMLFIYDSYFDLGNVLNDYPTYCIDAKAEPITWIYNGKKYYIMNINKDNEEIYGV